MAAQHSLQGQVETLNENISDFNEFIDSHGFDGEYRPIHFIGTPDSARAEQAVLDHWDEFLQFSQDVLNAGSVPREEAVGWVDTINLDYKRVLGAAQSLSR